jgi:hypothetical protein
MRCLRFALLALALLFTGIVSFARDTPYTDPRRPSFVLLVPDGWTIVKTENGVDLKHGDTAEVTLFVQGRAVDPSDFVRNVLPQIQQQHKNFHLMDQGACLFGKESASYIIYSGIGPKGPALTVKMVTMTNGHLTYVMFEQAPPEKYDDEKSAMQHIQDSFSPETIEVAGESSEKLDALHAAGVISDEEYATRKKGEAIFRDPRQPPYTVVVPVGWKALKNDTGVKLEKQPAGAGVAQLWVQPESDAPSAVITSVGSQFEKQWKDFRKLDQGEVRFGGLKGAYVAFTGVGGSGKPIIMKVVTTTDGKTTFTLFMMADLDQYKAIQADWDHIQRSFSIEGIGPSTDSGGKPSQ